MKKKATSHPAPSIFNRIGIGRENSNTLILVYGWKMSILLWKVTCMSCHNQNFKTLSYLTTVGNNSLDQTQTPVYEIVMNILAKMFASTLITQKSKIVMTNNSISYTTYKT